MPYMLVLISDDDKESVLKPLACDNPKSSLGFEDPDIERKCKLVANRLLVQKDVKNCYVKHYN